MSQPFNSRAVLLKASKELRRDALSGYSAYANFDWNSLGENDVDPILEHLNAVDEAQQRLIRVRMRQVHALGSPSGTKVLLKAGVENNVKGLGAELSSLKNAHQRAFWCLAHYEKLFDCSLVYGYTHSLPKNSLETRGGFPESKVEITSEALTQLIGKIKTAYGGEERASHCQFDYREHDGIHLIHAYPSNYLDEVESYLPDGSLGSVPVFPPFHVVIYVDEFTGTATVLAKGGEDKHDALFESLAGTVFHTQTPPRAGKNTFDLSVFKNPNYEFWTDPVQYLGAPRVIKMRLRFPENRHHKALFEVDPDDPHDDIYRLLQRKLSRGLEELARSTVLSVELRVTFSPPGEPEVPIDFRITAPRWCTLEYDGQDGIIRRYLRPWGIETDGKRVAALPGPVLVA